MSRILRRPMFRGGKVDSRGTGITSGLGYENGGRVGYDNGGQILQKARSRIRGPQDFPLGTFALDTNLGVPVTNRSRIRGPRDFIKGSTIEEAEGLIADASGSSGDTVMERARAEVLANASDPFVPDETPGFDGSAYNFFTMGDEIREEMPKLGVGSDFDKDMENYLIGDSERDTGLEALRKGNIRDVGKTTIEDLTTTEKVKTPKPGDDDEPEVTMTDLEKALGLDRARQEYAADALAAASKAFFEGRGFEAISDAAQVKSKAPDIKRLAGLEEFKAKKAQELYKLKKKEFAPGNVEKTVEYLVGQGMSKDEAIKRATKQSGTFAEELSKNSVGGTILPQGFALAAETFYGSDYKGDVTAVDVIQADKSTQLPDGIYSDKENKLIFEVKDKKVVSDRSYS
jgi:hypothetical protein